MRHKYFEDVIFDEKALAKSIGNLSTPLEDSTDLNPLMNYIGDARCVLLGEASHGTHEYYTWRMKITKRLIEEKGFSFIAVEGDWPDCYKVNRYIKGYSTGAENPIEILNTFNRWPTWMWANWEMVAFIEWLKYHNEKFLLNDKVGFYGLDVYSLWESMDAIVEFLKKEDPKILQTAINAKKCFDQFGQNEGQSYARASTFIPTPCTSEIVTLLSEIRSKMDHYSSDLENSFSTEQNALVAVNAERYYRAMVNDGSKSWNIRDRHMMETIDRLMNFHGKNSKIIIWEHNTHIGDARATDMVNEGMVNVGQLMTEGHAKEGIVLVGFGSYKGSVIASTGWGKEVLNMEMPDAIDGSWEHILHTATGGKNRLLMLDNLKNLKEMGNHIGHRAIGVVYNPEREKFGSYVPSILPMRYDAFVFIDETKALHPLSIKADDKQIPETYPFGF